MTFHVVAADTVSVEVDACGEEWVYDCYVTDDSGIKSKVLKGPVPAEPSVTDTTI